MYYSTSAISQKEPIYDELSPQIADILRFELVSKYILSNLRSEIEKASALADHPDPQSLTVAELENICIHHPRMFDERPEIRSTGKRSSWIQGYLTAEQSIVKRLLVQYKTLVQNLTDNQQLVQLAHEKLAAKLALASWRHRYPQAEVEAVWKWQPGEQHPLCPDWKTNPPQEGWTVWLNVQEPHTTDSVLACVERRGNNAYVCYQIDKEQCLHLIDRKHSEMSL